MAKGESKLEQARAQREARYERMPAAPSLKRRPPAGEPSEGMVVCQHCGGVGKVKVGASALRKRKSRAKEA